ncbi:MerR HTH family regulatory protein [Thermomonospora echinospora]|uniref:MerR HTH family regulatory protein n=1 Tax=Thermomonospora echinospora TaxID=1992 RepID=A0A1H6CZH9_9ACTN|nr:chaperone modulator CbpM [Thermomonospora echinospora]SEG78237.1 MerR HTH family regulatory protein [Thermomonospora echinospora]
MSQPLPGAVYALVRTGPARMDLETFARAGGAHPELVRRLVRLGLLDPEPGPSGEPWFPPAQLTALARIQRLRAGCALNYAALGLVIDLLDRIAALEEALRRSSRQSPPDMGGRPWTPTA